MPAGKKLLPHKRREQSYQIAVESHLKNFGDPEGAKRHAKAEVRKACGSGVGSMLLWLTIGVMMLELIYYAIKIWSELNARDPSDTTVKSEVFGL